MNAARIIALSECSDAELVARSIAGDRDAFGQIVTQYQSLICSLAYNATGSLSRSEDLAQDTFVTAWKQMRSLREPAKFRPWLCGIARNIIHSSLRRQARQPAHEAGSLDEAHYVPAEEPPPTEQAISREEEAILWRSIEQIPATYREPLILFYREQQSVERVAAALELSEDAVKQRLSRGRKLLQEQVASFVEGTLRRSIPGKAFTLGVIAALPLLATSASAATVGATVAKGGAAAKIVSVSGLLSAVLGPIVGIAGAWMGAKAGLEHAQSEEERQHLRRGYKRGLLMVGSFLVVIGALRLVPGHFWQDHPAWTMGPALVLPLAYVSVLMFAIVRFNRRLREIRRRQYALMSPEQTEVVRGKLPPVREWRSRWSLLGLPLIHLNLGWLEKGDIPVARGWIAIGTKAEGVLLAIGGRATGGIALGGVAVGLVALGGVSLGVISFAGVAIGVFAVGGAALGWYAFGGGAAGWAGAVGGSAWSHDYAVGGDAVAAHANDAVAQAFTHGHAFFSLANNAMLYMSWLVWLPMLPLIWMSLAKRKAGEEKMPG